MSERTAPGPNIEGGPAPEEAAVILAVIEQIMADEGAAAQAAAGSQRPGEWAASLRPRPSHAPVPSHLYDAIGGWGLGGDDPEAHLPT